MLSTYLTINEAAPLLQMAPAKLRYEIFRKRFKAYRLNGKSPFHRIIIKRTTVTQYLAKHKSLRNLDDPSTTLSGNRHEQNEGRSKHGN